METNRRKKDSPLPRGGGPGPRHLLVTVPLLLAGLSACEVEWGGAQLALEEPSPPGGGEAPQPGPEEGETALPEPPFLFVARVDPDGRALAVPVARVTAAGPTSLAWPDSATPRYRARFDSAVVSPGRELTLLRGSGRSGSLVLDGATISVDATCPSVAAATVLLAPGRRPPAVGFAVGPGSQAEPVAPTQLPSLTRRNRLFGPILAERLLREAGVERVFLARRGQLEAVAFRGDTVPGMAASYLVNDSLAAGPPPGGPSASVFFLARYDPTEGYVPVWSVVRTYEGAPGKEAFEYLDWMVASGRRFELLRRYDGSSARLAVLRRPASAGEDPGLWIEPEGCASFELLAEATEEGRRSSQRIR